jgi:hypothetical protein
VGEPPSRVCVDSPESVQVWARETGQRLDGLGIMTVTFVVDILGQLWIADRCSEHVQCACGGPVLSAGEIGFSFAGGGVEVVAVTNQSTGFCPEPESWPAVEAALQRAGLVSPGGFTTEFVFRRCPDCHALGLVKDYWFECAECGSPLPDAWNCGAI